MEKTHQRLQKLLSHLNVRPSKFARDLGYKHPQNVYNYVEGSFEASADFYERLKGAYPEVNINWVKRGHGNIIEGESLESELERYKKENDNLRSKVAQLEKEKSIILLMVESSQLGKPNASKLLPVNYLADTLFGLTLSPILGQQIC